MPSFNQLGNAFSQMGSAFRTFLGRPPTTPLGASTGDADLHWNGWPEPRQNAGPEDRSYQASQNTTHARLRASDQRARSWVENRSRSPSHPPISATLSAAREVRARIARKSALEIEDLKRFNEEIELAKALSLVDQAISDERVQAPVSSSDQTPSHPISVDEPLAVALANSVIMEDPELKARGLEFIVGVGPQCGTNTSEELLALGLAYSAIESDPDLKDKRLQLSVSSNRSDHAKKYDEDLKLAIELSQVEY